MCSSDLLEMASRRMEPAGAERHRREARRVSERERTSQTPYNNCALDVRRWALDVCFMTQVQVQDDRLTAIRAAFPKEGLFAEKAWLLSPNAFPIGKKFLGDLEQLGHRLSVFQRACNQLYHLSVNGK